MASEATAPKSALFVVVDAEHVMQVADDHPVGDRSLRDDASYAASHAGPLLAAFLGSAGRPVGALYELSPESQQRLTSARLDTVGTYFRGVLRSPDGKTSHQVQIRQAEAAPQRSSGLDLAMATQLAAMQAQLDRIEEAVCAIGFNVKHVLTFLEIQQGARVEACITVLDEVYRRARRLGSVNEIDWDRLTGVELELETQRYAVLDELKRRLSGELPRADPAARRKILETEVDPSRIAKLCDQHRLLLIGLGQVTELTLLRRFQESELKKSNVASSRERLRKLERQHLSVLASMRRTAELGRTVAARNSWTRLRSDGILIGARKDAKHIGEIQVMCDELEQIATQSRSRPALVDDVSLTHAPRDAALLA